MSRIVMTPEVTYDWSVGKGCKVSKFERLLVLGSTELPDCRCGSEMKIIKSDAIGSDAEVRTYRCPQCEHELRLTTWKFS
jgi:predicted SprT family Zn-dependent metalloprotease